MRPLYVGFRQYYSSDSPLAPDVFFENAIDAIDWAADRVREAASSLSDLYSVQVYPVKVEMPRSRNDLTRVLNGHDITVEGEVIYTWTFTTKGD